MTGLRQQRKILVYKVEREMHLFISFINHGKSVDGHIFELIKLNVISCLCKFLSQVFFCIVSLLCFLKDEKDEIDKNNTISG